MKDTASRKAEKNKKNTTDGKVILRRVSCATPLSFQLCFLAHLLNQVDTSRPEKKAAKIQRLANVTIVLFALGIEDPSAKEKYWRKTCSKNEPNSEETLKIARLDSTQMFSIRKTTG